MGSWFFDGYAYFFSIPAILGTAYFLFSLILGGLGGDAEAGFEIDVDVGDSPVAEFSVLSLQTLSAFAMGSGWMGFGALRFMGLDLTTATLIAIASGVGVAWILVSLLRALWKLQSSGNVPLDSALGQTGTVSVSVPPKGNGSGRVTVVIGKKQREFNAAQSGDEPIGSKTRVGVVGVDRASNTLSVEVI